MTGNYGPGFLGLALNSGTYVADDEELGIVAYGGILTRKRCSVVVEPKGPVRRRIFIGPLSVMISVDAGEIQQFSYRLGASRWFWDSKLALQRHRKQPYG
jgi:hypothetical protein